MPGPELLVSLAHRLVMRITLPRPKHFITLITVTPTGFGKTSLLEAVPSAPLAGFRPQAETPLSFLIYASRL